MFCLQAYPVEKILTNFSKTNKGAAIVSKLKKGIITAVMNGLL